MSIEDDIEDLREELPWIYSNPPHIMEISEDHDITIVAADRPDKAVIIGPGGYIAGKLAKKYGKPLSITAHTDHMIKTFRRKESKRLCIGFQGEGDHEIIVGALARVLEGTSHREDITVAVALSGGRDSLASAILLKDLFDIQAFTVYPSDMILPPHVREVIDDSVRKLGVRHEYIDLDFSEIIEKSLEGRIHPCGHCHRAVTDSLLRECSKRGISAIGFGELLPTGSQALRMQDDVLIINVPAFLALNKKDTTDIASSIHTYTSYTMGCPLMKAVHNRYPFMKYATAKRVLREVRAGVLEPGEALKYIQRLL
jgi:predicted PP-loop superfamily ATPase